MILCAQGRLAEAIIGIQGFRCARFFFANRGKLRDGVGVVNSDMMTSRSQWYLSVLGTALLTATLGLAQETDTETSAPDTETATLDVESEEATADDLLEKYQVITDRNPFNLQPPPPPPPPQVEEEEPAEEEVPIEELNITLAGVSGQGAVRRVWLSMTVPAGDSGQAPVERFIGLQENDEQHGVKVTSIEANGDVDIVYSGETVNLTLETHGYKSKKSKSQKKTSKPTTRANASNRRVTTPTSQSTTGNRTTTNRSTPQTTSGTSRSQSRAVGAAGGAVRSIPSRPVRTQPQQRLTRDEQITILETQKALSEKEGVFFPPLPPLRR